MLGEWKDRTDQLFGFKWQKELINALATFFSYNQDAIVAVLRVRRVVMQIVVDVGVFVVSGRTDFATLDAECDGIWV